MRGIVFAVVTALALGASGLLPSRAYALTQSGASGLAVASAQASVTQDIAYICHRWWQWHGARWVRSCWRPGQDPCWNAPGCNGPDWYSPGWYGWGRYWW